jgi:thiamine pyrophosphate-dependent acetolactate synthase large subunit-like protein
MSADVSGAGTTMLSIPAAIAAIARARQGARAAGGSPIVVVTMSALPYWPADDADYRLVNLMGSAGAIGLGLALGRPDRPVWVIDGDGSLLMQLGVLAAIGAAAPAGFAHLVIANGVYAISGEQPTPGPASWPQLFQGAGFPSVVECRTGEEIERALSHSSEGPLGIAIVCDPARPQFPAGAFDVDPAGEARRVRSTLAR